MTQTYVVRVANLSVLNRQPEADAVTLVEGDPHLVVVCEARRGWEPVVPRVPGYRWLARRPGSPDTVGSREVGLLVRADVEVAAYGVEQLSHAVPRSPMAHDRWGTWARVVLPGGVRALAWSTHRNAFVQRPDGGVRRLSRGTEQYRLHVRSERALLREHAADGWPLLGGGDFNYRVPRGAVLSVGHAWRHAPHRTFPEAGWAYAPHWFDGVCWDPGAFTMVGGLDVIRRDRTGSDHDWLTAAFTAAVTRG